jgi:hypothetical protein
MSISLETDRSTVGYKVHGQSGPTSSFEAYWLLRCLAAIIYRLIACFF